MGSIFLLKNVLLLFDECPRTDSFAPPPKKLNKTEMLIVCFFSFPMTHPPLNWGFVHFWGGCSSPVTACPCNHVGHPTWIHLGATIREVWGKPWRAGAEEFGEAILEGEEGDFGRTPKGPLWGPPKLPLSPNAGFDSNTLFLCIIICSQVSEL